MKSQIFLVFCCVVLSNAEDYQDSLKKLWDKDSESVIDVSRASIVIQPSRFSNQYGRKAEISYTYPTYGFRPRAIPVADEAQERSNYYNNDVNNKSDILFPGNYLPIAKEKGDRTDNQYGTKPIPLIRTNESQRRSLDVDEPIIEKPEDFSEATASRRSLSYFFGEDGDDKDYSEEEDIKDEVRKKNGLKLKKQRQYKKYMLPLLLAYKMKYFALVPVMIGGLVLLIGATGLAGFFFALFAAVMGLQKGGY